MSAEVETPLSTISKPYWGSQFFISFQSGEGIGFGSAVKDADGCCLRQHGADHLKLSLNGEFIGSTGHVSFGEHRCFRVGNGSEHCGNISTFGGVKSTLV